MAVVALAAGGALLGGSVIGGSFGIGLGWLVGSTIGQLLFGGGEDTVREGPRLGDLQVQSSTYGRAIPIIYGNARVAGNVIWATDIREVRNEERQGGGKGGGPSVTTITYEYFGRFAVALCEGEVEAVRRVWADGKLILDYSDTAEGGRRYKHGINIYRVYKGSEDQPPDPLIEADKGADSVPAHRGLCYIVFEDLPLRDFGNRLPNITAEVVNAFSASTRYDTGDAFSSQVSPESTSFTVVPNSAVFRLDRPTYYIRGDDSLLGPGWFEVNRYTGEFDDFLDWSELWRYADEESEGLLVSRVALTTITRDNPPDLVTVNSTPIFDYFQPYVYVTCEMLTNTTLVEFRIEDGGRWVFTGAVGNTPGLIGGTGFVFYGPPPAYPRYLVTVASVLGSLNNGGGAAIWKDGVDFNSPVNYTRTLELMDQDTAAANALGVAVDRDAGRGWVLYEDGRTVREMDLLVGEFGASWDIFDDAVGTQDLNRAESLAYDRQTGHLVFWLTQQDGADHAMVRIDPDGPSLEYERNFGSAASALRRHVARPNTLHTAEVDGRVDASFGAKLGDSEWAVLETGTFTEVTERVQITGVSTSNAYFVWDALVECVWTYETAPQPRYFLNSYTTARIELDEVVLDLCQKAGLSASDVDVSDLDGTELDGYIVTKPMPARSAIEELVKAFFFDGVQEDYQLKFRFRSGASQVTIPWDDLAAQEGGSDNQTRVQEPIQQESELPRSVTVSYLNKERDYETGTQQARRIADVVGARSNLPVELPIVLTDTEGAEVADVTLNTAWRERQQIDFQVGPAYLRYSPGDVVTVTKEQTDGTTGLFKVRITSMDVGAGMVIQMRGVAQESASFSPTAEAQSTAIAAKPGIKTEVDSVPLLWNGPVLIPGAHDDGAFYGGAGLAWYVNDPAWIAANLYSSPDQTSPLDILDTVAVESYRFRVLTPLPKWTPQDPWAVRDLENTMRVQVLTPNWQPESVTRLAMMSDRTRNLVLVGRELIQFQTATAVGGRLYDLTGCLRGRFGTEWAMGERTTGEVGWLIDADKLLRLGSLDNRGEQRFYAAVTVGQPVDVTPARTAFTNQSAALRPWAPAQIRGSWSSGTVTVTWARRTRYGGRWKDGAGDVPLNEDTEEYEVDVIDYEGNVAREVTGLTSPTYTYSASNRSADFANTGALGELSGEVGMFSNLDFETNPNTHWTFADGDMDAVTFLEGLGPNTGSRFAAESFTAGDVDMYQLAVMPDYVQDYFRSGRVDLVFDFYHANTQGDSHEAAGTLDILDDDDNVLATASTGALVAAAADTWEKSPEMRIRGFDTLGGAVPRKVRIRLTATVVGGFTQPNVAFDTCSLRLEATDPDEPATLVRVYQISQSAVDRGYAGRGVV